MKHSRAFQQLSFQARLERIASGMNYFAVSVPEKITRILGTRGPVPVAARINRSEIFVASLYPVGGGRHYLRIKDKIRKSVHLEEGDRARVQITVRDRAAEVSIPSDLKRVLRAEGLVKDFESLPIGQRSFILRKIEDAAKPETREKRIRDAVEEVCRRKEKVRD